MSSKGQIVIPLKIRETIQADEGTLFAVIDSNDSIILKKIQTPTKEQLLSELKKHAVEGKRRLTEKGIKEEDILTIIEKSRKHQ